MEANKVRSVEIEILGQRMTLRTHEDPKWVKEVAEFASARLKEAQKRAKTAPSHQVALLALMDLAEDYLRSKQRVIDFKQNVSKKTNRIMDALT